MKTHCPICSAPWPQALRKPEIKIYCDTCRDEKRARAQARILDSLPAHEARAASYRARWEAMTPDEQRAASAKAKSELWG